LDLEPGGLTLDPGFTLKVPVEVKPAYPGILCTLIIFNFGGWCQLLLLFHNTTAIGLIFSNSTAVLFQTLMGPGLLQQQQQTRAAAASGRQTAAYI
jgi:hypothetical protein